MAEFDPSKPFETVSTPAEFDPNQPFDVPAESSGNAFLDAHPAALTAVKGALGDLPMAGAMVGGAIGGGAGAVGGMGVGSVPGAAVGAIAGASTGGAAGSAIADTLDGWIFGKPKSSGEVAKEALKQGAIAGAGEALLGPLGQFGVKALAKTEAGQAVGQAAAKAGEVIFRVPAKIITRYAHASELIKQMSQDAGGSIAEAAATVRKGFADSLDRFRGNMNFQITQALKQDGGKTLTDVTPIIQRLEAAKANLNSSLHSTEIGHIDTWIAKLKGAAPVDDAAYQVHGYDATGVKSSATIDTSQLAGGNNPGTYFYGPQEATGRMASDAAPQVVNDAADKIIILSRGGREAPKYMANLTVLNQIKQKMQDLATSAYRTPGLFGDGNAVANSMKGAGAEARKLLNAAAKRAGFPEVETANQSLSLLHTIEDGMNKSLIKQDAAESALIAAGSGASSRNLRALTRLEKLTGGNFVSKAEDLAAMKLLEDASAKKTGVGGLIGGVAGGFTGNLLGHPAAGAAVGAATGAAATTPLALKYLMDSGLAGGQAMSKLASTPYGRQLLGQGLIHATLPTRPNE